MVKPILNPMAIALEMADQASAMGDVPVGAVVIYQQKVIAASYNRVEADQNPIAHAEILAIRLATKALRTKWLSECDMYVTLEPCPMCAQALALARIRRLYYGAEDAKGGGVNHGPQIFRQKGCNHHPEVYAGLMETECRTRLQFFFQNLRQEEL